jgi:hypothetical protein
MRSMSVSPTKNVSAAFAVRGVDRLLDEVEGDGADQDTGAERHDHADDPFVYREPQRGHSPQDQGCAAERAPQERLTHPSLPAPRWPRPHGTGPRLPAWSPRGG